MVPGGLGAVDEFEAQIVAHVSGTDSPPRVYPHRIAFNALPEIDVFLEDGYTKEEWKVIAESRKILHMPELPVSCTAVRVPVFTAHSEAVHVETTQSISPEVARKMFAGVSGVVVVDHPGTHSYPLATEAAGRDEIFVGRIRSDASLRSDTDDDPRRRSIQTVTAALSVSARPLVRGALAAKRRYVCIRLDTLTAASSALTNESRRSVRRRAFGNDRRGS